MKNTPHIVNTAVYGGWSGGGGGGGGGRGMKVVTIIEEML